MKRAFVGWTFTDFGGECGFGSDTTLCVEMLLVHDASVLDVEEILFKKITLGDGCVVYSHGGSGMIQSARWRTLHDFVVRQFRSLSFVFEPIVLAADPALDSDFTR